MTDLARLSLEIETAQVKRAKADLDRLSESANRAEREALELSSSGRRVETSLGGVSGAARTAAGALGGLALGGLAIQAIQTADAYALLTARLSLVTRGTEDLARVQGEVFSLSQQTRSGLEETASLYIRLAQASETLGVSQQDVLDVTRSISQALVVSGTNSQSAAAALMQLGQGLASGTLRGEELNSVLEQAPRLARAIADGLGVSIGDLRKLGEQGALTSQAVFQALQSQAGRLGDEFAKMPTTVDQALTQVRNSVSGLIGDINQATGATSALATSLTNVANQLSALRGRFSPDGSAAQLSGKVAEADLLRQAIKDNAGRDGTVAILRRNLARLESEIAALRAAAPQVTIQGQDFSNRGRGRNFGSGSIDPREIVAAPRITTNSGRMTDQLRAEEAATRALAEARREASEINARYLESGEASVDRLMQSNQALREEIEVMGLSAEAINVVEIARTSANRALAEETLLMAKNAGEGPVRLQQLEQEVALLAERESLLRQRGEKIDSNQGQQVFSDYVQPEDKRSISTTFEDSITDGILNGFRNGRSLTDIFLDELKAQFAKTILQPIIAPIAQAGNNAIGDIIGLIGSFFTGGGGGTAGFASTAGISGGRANGGGVDAGATYIVGERGPEILRMGKSAGYVTPTEATGRGKSVQITYAPQITIDSRSDRAAVAADVDQALVRNNQQLMAKLKAAGVV